MSVEAFSGLPFQAGQAVAAAAGRTALWVLSAYMRAPLRNTAIVALVSLSAMAGSNALYRQSGHHPAPLFGSFEAGPAKSAKAKPSLIVPAERPAKLMVTTPAKSLPAPAASATATLPNEPIGNADVFEIQRKLTAFKLFDGKVDGLYGPRTARAIKAFQEKVGQPATGKLTPELVELIKSTPIIAEPSQIAPAPVALAPAAAEAPAATLETEPLAETPPAAAAEALPAPAPLVAAPEDAPAETVPEIVPTADAAEGLSTLEMTSPPARTEVASIEMPEAAPATETTASTAPAKRVVQTIAVRASTPEPVQAMPEELTTPLDVARIATDPKVVSAVQRGLASLGFLHGEIDGVAGEATAKAIRNFEVYYNYNVTGRITSELVNLLVQNGAVL